MFNYFKYIAISIVFLVSFSSCRKKITYSKGNLTFSLDTVIFDTVFTTVGSVTKALKVYNPSKNTVIIDDIILANGTNSNFRLNIDGEASNRITKKELRGRDSLYVFVEVTVDPNNTTTPLIITDSILFITNGKTQDVDLAAWGQDAYFYPTVLFGDQQTWTLPTDKPNVFYGWAIVDSASCLILQEGTQLHFHKGSGMYAAKESCIKSLGTPENNVVIQGDRLEYQYSNEPGQWERIWLSATSRDHVFQNTIIKNGNIGIHVDTVGTSLEGLDATLTLINTKIENMSGVGLLAQGSNINAFNSVFANCGQYCTALVIGGDYEFYHCTFANYWNYGSREDGLLIMNNYYESANGSIIKRDMNKATFKNCIIHGNNEEELTFDFVSGAEENYQFDNCILKTEKNTATSNFNNTLLNPENIEIDGVSSNPIFIDYENFNYDIFEQSVAKDKGNNSFTNEMLNYTLNTNDINNNSRSDNQPDIGAYEFQ